MNEIDYDAFPVFMTHDEYKLLTSFFSQVAVKELQLVGRKMHADPDRYALVYQDPKQGPIDAALFEFGHADFPIALKAYISEVLDFSLTDLDPNKRRIWIEDSWYPSLNVRLVVI